MIRDKKIVSRSLLLGLLFALLLPFVFAPRADTQGRRPVKARANMQNNQTQSGLQFRLSEGAEANERPQSLPTPAAAPLSDGETANLLKRLPPIKAAADDEKDFALRDRSLPPPRTGQTVAESFPPAGTLNAPEPINTGPLEVVRFAPEGELPLAPHLSVTFSQPMVAVTSQTDAAQNVPVKLTPQLSGNVAGKWRWLGTKTLLFDPDNRFPMATNYTVEIPAGTKSATGGTLAAAKRWSFATPPVKLLSSWPNNGPHGRNPVFFAGFDQGIDAAAMLKSIRLHTNARSWPLRLATPEEIEADDNVRRMTKSAEPHRWLAFRVADTTENPLPAETNFTVTIEPGAPSAEGPRPTAAAQEFQFNTYGPLRLTNHHCGYGQGCEPFMPWSLEFSNPIDAAAFEPKLIRVTPELPNLKAQVYGNTINISGASHGNTSYVVTIDAALRDQFDQTLGTSQTVTFRVGPAQPNLAVAGDGFVVLDPNAPPRFSVYTINHRSFKATAYAVGPEHWRTFTKFMREGRGDNKPLPPIGRQVFSKLIEVAAQPDQLTETPVDLSPALNAGVGHVVLSIEAVQPPRTQWERRTAQAWIQSTKIGLTAFVDQTNLLGWATSLKDGKPLGDVEMGVDLGDTVDSGFVKADKDGFARLALTNRPTGKMLLARRGNDVAMLPESVSWWNNGSQWQQRSTSDALRWFVFDDRGMYKPGETVYIKGWVRRVGSGKGGDVGIANDALGNLTYILRDSRGNDLQKGALRLNALGGFDTSFKLPPTVNLGYATLTLNAEARTAIHGLDHQHQLRIQEFRRPEYEVKATAGEGPHFVGGFADVTVAANYYAGGGLPNAETNWIVTAKPTTFTPPNRSDFTFGTWTPWWVDYNDNGSGNNVQTLAARTDAAGKHHLRIDFDTIAPPRATSVRAEAAVQDVNRQSISGATNLLVHPAALYVGLRSPRTFVQLGEPLVVQSIVTDLDGKAVVNREVRMRAVLLDWVFDKGEWKQQEKNPQECVIKSANDAADCRFETKEGGSYRVTATIIDDRERRNQSELTLWVAGGKQPPQREVAQEKVELIPDRKEYAAGETAEILVQAPFAGAEGVLTLRRSGLVRSERFTMTSASHTLKIKLEEGWTPNIFAQVDLVGAAARTDAAGQTSQTLPKRPAFASGQLNLSLPPRTRTLAVKAVPRDKALEPGGETSVEVELRDAAGKPVAGGEVAVVVVDEAVLGLTNYTTPDPVSSFYGRRNDDVSDHHLRQNVVLAKPGELIGQMNANQSERMEMRAGLSRAPMAMASAMPEAKAMRVTGALMAADALSPADANTPIELRSNFDALATFAAALPTDANGRASVKVKVPDNLTRYRVMAVAVAGARQFGSGEASITARLPLMVRPSAPRFLNFGDRFELPVVVQNQTDAPMQVDVAVRATNALFVETPPKGGTLNAWGRRVTVPANDRVEVRFPATTVRPGTARFQFAGAAGKWADAAEVSLPVWTPATTEAFATYGEIDAGAGIQTIWQPVKAPSDAITSFGGLEITTSSTQLQALTDAVIYLANYPYECAEQISSRILAIAALRDVLAAFDAKGLPQADELVASVQRDLKRLEGLQNPDGGFGFWRRGGDDWPYLGIHAAHALQRAKEKNFDVPPDTLNRSRQYLQTIEQHIPGWYGIDERRALIAYSLYVRNRMGDAKSEVAAKARSLIADAGLERLSLEALGWLLPVLSGDAAQTAALRRHLGNRAEETAGTAHFTTAYSDGAHLLLHSSRRADGVILESLIGDQPQSDLIPKLVRGLLAHRKAGRWENTQENCFVLLALDRYFQVYEKTTPDFVARAWLGDAFAGAHDFRGRTTERHQVTVPMKFLAAQSGLQNLALSKEGAGRLYYRIGMNYAPTSLQLKPADYGFTVQRVYEAVDDPNDVRRLEDGTWRIKAGAQVRVRLTMVAQARRYHVALVDPLPAGLEALNPALAVTGSIPRDPKDTTRRWWWGQWFEHQNLRDERVEAFTSLLWEGVYNYSYVARATTPGVFVVPPTKAEEMYHPETFGRGASDRVVIE